ncbi:MAG: 2-C-methyl-D-erythritol 4-phosphate cytidylyltransferase [Peptococcaceae bacterium]|jgi:2-C-methyl-D-erythritol 4-phosphate cytidylyltransferase|nr:2-C-methyl-D-erythritol 4-phosphate cytidylyltransferase [Peptococcaceae bacterium]
MDRIGAVIPAAGEGKRMQAGVNKQWLELAGLPVLIHTLRIFQQSEGIAEIVVVGAASERRRLEKLVEENDFSKVAAVAEGGAERQASVYAGLQVLNKQLQRVVIHDGARPLLTAGGLRRFLREAADFEAALMAVEVKDTVKIIDAEGWVLETPLRTRLKAVQTPQVFSRYLLEQAHERAAVAGYVGTDDASLLEWLGIPVRVLAGEITNIKITTPEDLWLAEMILNKRSIE